MKHLAFGSLLFGVSLVFVVADCMVKLPSIVYSSLSHSYRANIKGQSEAELRDLKRKKECQTDWANFNRWSSSFYRKLAYEALMQCGHKYPELVIVVSDPHGHHAFAGPVDTNGGLARGINFCESVFSKESYGAQRLIMFHEAWHIVCKDYYTPNSSGEESQAIERAADIEGARAAGCELCARERADYLLQKFYKRPLLVDRVCKEVATPPRTMRDVACWDLKYLDEYIISVRNCMKVIGDSFAQLTHPLDLERALNMHKLAITELKGKSCVHHAAIARAINKKTASESMPLLKKALSQKQVMRDSVKAKELEKFKKMAALKKVDRSSDRSSWLFNQRK